MTAKVLQLLALLCSSALLVAFDGNRLHRHEGDEAFENYLREAIENFKIQMPLGIPEIGMPVLDPLKLQDMDFQVNENLATLNLKLWKINIRNLSNFYLNRIAADLECLFMHLNLSIPLLIIDGSYDLHGRLLKIFPMEGHGNMSINATELLVAGTGKLILTNESLKLDLLQLDIYWDNISLVLENFMGGGNFAEVLQKALSGIGRDVFLKYKPLILAPLQEALKCKVNQILDRQIVKDILKEILPSGLKNEIQCL